MNNQGFLGALAAVAVKQDQGLLLDLIVSDDAAQQVMSFPGIQTHSPPGLAFRGA